MNIGILGAGWLGKPLAHFLQNSNHKVKVSVRSTEKQNELLNQCLKTYLLHIKDDNIYGNLSFFEAIDVLIVSPTKATEVFNRLISQIIGYQIPHVILFSSTGIYSDCECSAETTPLKTNKPKVALLKAIEELFLQKMSLKLPFYD